MKHTLRVTLSSAIAFAIVNSIVSIVSCTKSIPAWEAENPVKPIPASPLGIATKLSELPDPPTPERVRLGRWLFYDKSLSPDNTISCATCHRPENAFSEPTPHSTGIRGQQGGRKSPTFVNAAFAFYPLMFWDGRAATMEDQALGPIANPVEMGNTHDAMVQTLRTNSAYAPYFKEAFGSEEITAERIAKAIADYERTRMSGNSPWDKWRKGDENAVSAQVKLGSELFFNKGKCTQCHVGENFTDSKFHNLGIGWSDSLKVFADTGRYVVSKNADDIGAFKTPTVREITKHAPYMHDGSIKTLKEVVAHYNRGGSPNPHLSPKMSPLNLTDDEVNSIVAFMEALSGEGYQDVPPVQFPHK